MCAFFREHCTVQLLWARVCRSKKNRTLEILNPKRDKYEYFLTRCWQGNPLAAMATRLHKIIFTECVYYNR